MYVDGINSIVSFHSLSTWIISTHCCCHVKVGQIKFELYTVNVVKFDGMCFASSCTLSAWFLSLAGIDLLLAVYISTMAGSEVIFSTVLANLGQTSCHDVITNFVTSNKKSTIPNISPNNTEVLSYCFFTVCTVV